MRRRAFSLVAMASLAVLVVAAGSSLWRHFHPANAVPSLATRSGGTFVHLGGDGLTARLTMPFRMSTSPAGWWVDEPHGWDWAALLSGSSGPSWYRYESGRTDWVAHTGSGVLEPRLSYSHRYYEFHLPTRSVCILAGVAPVAWLIVRGVAQRRARRRRKLGLCLVCGYDLRGIDGRCPECGTPAPATSAGAAAGVL